MDVWEKLVELLADLGCNSEYCKDCEFAKNIDGCVRRQKGIIADHLIANGVTVHECGHWISLTECANAGVYCSVCHKKVYKEDYAWCNRKNKLRSDYCPHCGAKMMPQPPKGE